MRKGLMFFALILLAACNNATGDPVPPKTATLNKLIGRWRITALTLNGAAQTQECAIDDEYEFKDNGELFIRFNKGCSGQGDGNTGTYDYEVSEDGRFVTVSLYTDDKYNKPRDIKELTQTTLRYEYTEELARVNNYVVTFRRL
jgi:hypothetical protein